MKYDLLVSIVVYKPKLSQLQQTLDSLSQSELNIKVSLFDNSPSPLSPMLYSCKHPIDYVFSENNIGYGRAHNQNIFRNIDASKYILILNPDVFFGNLLLSTLIDRMEGDPEVGLCIPKICHPSGGLQMVNRLLPRPQDYLISFLNGKLKTDFFKTKKYDHYLLKDFNKNRPFVCPTISGCFMLFKNQAFVDVAGFDEQYFLYLEDTDLSRRVSKEYKTVVFSDLVAYHHWSRGAYRSPKLFVTFLSSMVRYFNKWGWFSDPLREKLNGQVQYYTPSTQNIRSYKENSVLNHVQV